MHGPLTRKQHTRFRRDYQSWRGAGLNDIAAYQLAMRAAAQEPAC